MTTRKELDNRMEAESYLISKGVLSPRRRTSSGDAAEAELTKALEEAKNSDLPLIWVQGRGWIHEPGLYLEALTAGTLAQKKR